MTYATVCSGIEAPTLAWSALGWRASWFSEIEPFCCALLAHRYPDVPNLGDMTRITEDMTDAHGPIDLLMGGTPCQSFSVAGLRKGLADPRGNLALEFLRLADAARPAWLAWENVPGVLSSNGGRDFGAFLGGLGELGYGWAYRVLDAQYFGVAQRRRRVFVVGHLGSWQRAAAVLFERHSLSGDHPPRRKARARVGTSVIKGAAIGRRPEAGPQFGEILTDGTCYTLNCTEQHAIAAVEDDHNLIVDALNARMGDGGPDDNAAQDHQLIPAIAHSLRRGTPGAGGVAGDDTHVIASPVMAHNGLHDQCGQTFVTHALRADGFDASEDGTGRGTPIVPVAFDTTQITSAANYSNPKLGDPCHPLAEGAHAPAVAFQTHGAGVRRLTPTECERLMGMPDGYTAIAYRGKAAADGPRYRALGNSIVVPVLRWIGERIQMVHEVAAKGEAK